MKTVRIPELKSRLSEHLRSVRKGRTLTILDRDTPYVDTSALLRLVLREPGALAAARARTRSLKP
jgi:antitoxin (DNA-binding transcriptional repressor) of toxin-antitoxin stability system